MNIVKQTGCVAIVKVGERYHVVRISKSYPKQVSSTMPSDMPMGGGSWVANATEAGVKYVSQGRSLSGAVSGFYRELRVC
jgi:hypothetical protein